MMACEETLKDLNSLKLIVKCSLAEKFVSGSERPCESKDFSETKKNREKLTGEIKIFIEYFVKDWLFHKNDKETCYPDIENELLALILILCGQNTKYQPWNTEATVQNCEFTITQILKLFKCKDVSELLSRNCKINLTKDIFQIICDDLTVNEWKHFPASVACYKWILEKIKQPELIQYLHFVLPPALFLTDDFVNENRITGVQCLDHIIQNITISELQLFGHGDVIYNALFPLLRTREADLIQVTIRPLLSLTTKLEFNLGKKDPTKWSKFDDILEIYLENMELEQHLDLRSCYISNLTLLITAAGRGIIRWSKRLLRIFDEFVQTAGKYDDEKTMNYCLKAMDKFCELSHEVTSLHSKHFLVTLLIALHFTTTHSTETECESTKLINCIKTVLGSSSEIEKIELKKDLQIHLSSNVNDQKFYNQMYDIFLKE